MSKITQYIDTLTYNFASGTPVQYGGLLVQTSGANGSGTWSIDGGSTWNSGSGSMTMQAGQIVTASFGAVQGYITPSPQAALIPVSSSAQITGIYTETPPYLCFTAVTAGSTVTLNANGGISTGNFYTSDDGSTWNSYTPGTAITLTNIGDKVYFWNRNSTLSISSVKYYKFAMTGTIAASGNANSMINFGTLAVLCYYKLFEYCHSLTTAPALPATTLANSCYLYMFVDCDSLTTAPALPATTLSEWCYAYMFHGCDSLTTAPALPATTLSEHCYSLMFYDCTSLRALNVSFTDWNTSTTPPTNLWVEHCTNTSDFVFTCPSALDTSTTGNNTVLSNWTINKI